MRWAGPQLATGEQPGRLCTEPAHLGSMGSHLGKSVSQTNISPPFLPECQLGVQRGLSSLLGFQFLPQQSAWESSFCMGSGGGMWS